MEEKILIQSKQYSMKKFIIAVCAISLLAWMGFIAHSCWRNYNDIVKHYYVDYDGIPYDDHSTHLPSCEHTEGISYYDIQGNRHYLEPVCKTYTEFKKIHKTVSSYMDCKMTWSYMKDGFKVTEIEKWFNRWLRYGISDFKESLFAFIPIPLAFILFLWLSKFSITITDKRVFGKAAFGKRVDLPVDLISSVGTSWLKGIDVGSSSGKIHFKLVKNQNKIHSVLSKLLMERQREKVNANTQSASNADELKKFKDLLDNGVITQAEYDEKKKQLLNL